MLYLLEEKWSQEGVQSALNVLNQDGVAITDARLQLVRVAGLGLLEDLQPSSGLHGLHPGISLALRIQHERAALAVPRADGILNGRIISRQPP